MPACGAMKFFVEQRGLRDDRVPIGYNWVVNLRQRGDVNMCRKEILTSTEITPMRVSAH